MFLLSMLGIKKELENTKISNGVTKIVVVERLVMNKVNKAAYKIKQLSSSKILWEVMPRIDGNKYVVTSVSNLARLGEETYMFAADEQGNIIDWSELEGSYRGEQDHHNCFKNIGYSTYE